MTDGPVETFRTHANYITAIRTLAVGSAWPLKDENTRLRHLAEKIVPIKSLQDGRKASIDEGQIHRSLANAWGSELLLGLAGAYGFEDELMRLTNNWAVVQCYYAVYHWSQAYTVSKGGARPDSHPKTQNEFIAHWITRGLQLAPWSMGVDSKGYRNLPAGKGINARCSAWIDCNESSAWDLYAKALRTTREDHLADAIKDARREKLRKRQKDWFVEEDARRAKGRSARKQPGWPQPNLDGMEKLAVDSKLRTFSLMDYLYRLRKKTQYVDTSMFTDGPQDELASIRVHDDLRSICAATGLLHEMHVGRLLPKGTFVGWVDAWLDGNMPSGKTLGLALRRDVLADVT